MGAALGVRVTVEPAITHDRASVVSHLTNLSIKNGILGSFKINKNGDTTLGIVTIQQIDKSKTNQHFVTLLTPPTSLTQ